MSIAFTGLHGINSPTNRLASALNPHVMTYAGREEKQNHLEKNSFPHSLVKEEERGRSLKKLERERKRQNGPFTLSIQP